MSQCDMHSDHEEVTMTLVTSVSDQHQETGITALSLL